MRWVLGATGLPLSRLSGFLPLPPLPPPAFVDRLGGLCGVVGGWVGGGGGGGGGKGRGKTEKEERREWVGG